MDECHMFIQDKRLKRNIEEIKKQEMRHMEYWH